MQNTVLIYDLLKKILLILAVASLSFSNNFSPSRVNAAHSYERGAFLSLVQVGRTHEWLSP